MHDAHVVYTYIASRCPVQSMVKCDMAIKLGHKICLMAGGPFLSFFFSRERDPKSSYDGTHTHTRGAAVTVMLCKCTHLFRVRRFSAPWTQMILDLKNKNIIGVSFYYYFILFYLRRSFFAESTYVYNILNVCRRPISYYYYTTS